MDYGMSMIYEIVTRGSMNNMVVKIALPEMRIISVDPGTPTFVENDIGNDYFNVTFRPSAYDEAARAPVGNTFLVQYKEDGAGEDEWKTVKQQGTGVVRF